MVHCQLVPILGQWQQAQCPSTILLNPICTSCSNRRQQCPKSRRKFYYQLNQIGHGKSNGFSPRTQTNCGAVYEKGEVRLETRPFLVILLPGYGHLLPQPAPGPGMRAMKAVQVAGSHTDIQTESEITIEILTVGQITKADMRHGKILFRVMMVWRTLAPNEVGESLHLAMKAMSMVISPRRIFASELCRVVTGMLTAINLKLSSMSGYKEVLNMDFKSVRIF